MSTFWKRNNRTKAQPQRQAQSAAGNDEAMHPISAQLASNVSWLCTQLGASADIIAREFAAPASGIEGTLIYIDHLVDKQTVNQNIVHPLLSEIGLHAELRPTDGMGLLKNKALTVGHIREIHNLNEALTQILEGNTVIFLQGCESAIAATSSGGEKRSVEEPKTQTVVKGPKESFTESMDTNLSLIRRRLRSPNLRIEFRQIGNQTKTKVAVLHMNGITDSKVVDEVMSRLDRINTDSILDSEYIEEFIQDASFTPFSLMLSTERPDAVSAGLLEGQFAIIVDGAPFALLAPVTFNNFFFSSEDYYQRFDIATFLRFIRLGAFFASLLIPSLFIALTTFHQEMIPSPLLISLAAQREGVPFPAFVEVLIMELTFEILREAGVRMPRAVGPAISIAGALVIGQAAVQAGIVSAALVIVVSFTALANFVIPSVDLSNSMRIVRFIMMMLAATLGLFGILCGMMALLFHLASLRSFGVAFLQPLSPFKTDSWRDLFIRMPVWRMKERPIGESGNQNRQGANPSTSEPRQRE
ncbi:spore germination protein [Paenibacillus xanthanilyticus]|uniref:Spore germination protein n=1 Tax=Paenibacillus xanthanilyticus TaxID=1783531 RepID=A0ABV8K6J2_9BACL